VMKSVFDFRIGLFYMLSVSMLLLTACAAAPTKEKAVEERAMARWDAYFSGDIGRAYEYQSPAYRSSVSLLQYKRVLFNNKVNWTGARFIESNCEEKSCKVKISLKYTVNGAVPGLRSFSSEQEIEETWVLTSGNWYLVPEN
jgi:hypothetical protein